MGGIGGTGTPSTDTAALQSINSQNKTFVNKDFTKNIAWLNNSVDTLSQWSQKLQKGVDQANQNALEQVQGIYADLFVMFAGLEPTGIDVGDLKYVIQGLGALLGINPDTPFPINLVEAAWHMFQNYIVPAPQFFDVIFDAIDAWALDLGLSQEFIDSTNELRQAFEDLWTAVGTSMDGLFDAFSKLLAAFMPTINDLGPLWDSMINLIDLVPWDTLAPVLSMLADLGVPFIDALTAIVNVGTSFLSPLSFISGSQIGTLGSNAVPPIAKNTTVWSVGADGAEATAWVWDDVEKAFTTTGNATAKEIHTQQTFPATPGQKFTVKGSLKWTGIPTAANDFGVQLQWYQDANPVSVTNLNIPGGHGTTGGFTESINQADVVVPVSVNGVRFGARVGTGISTGTVWAKGISVQLQGGVATSAIDGLDDLLGGFLPLDFFNGLGGMIDPTQPDVFSYFSNLLPLNFFDGLAGMSAPSQGDVLGYLEGLIGLDAPLETIQQFITNSLTPQGVLTNWTQIPGHLFGNIMPGETSQNLLPDAGFDDPATLNGQTLWTHDATVGRTLPLGSAKTVAGSVLRQLTGVPITTKPGQVTDLETWVFWTGAVVGAGKAIQLCANAYDASDNLINDPVNRILASISGIATNSSGWQQLSGSYQAPAGTKYVRICLEVTAVASAGSFWFDDGSHILHGFLDASMLGNIENITQLLPTSVAGFSGLFDLLQTFGHLTDGLGTAYSGSTQSGLEFPDLFGMAQQTVSTSFLSLLQSTLNTQILTRRTNKPTGQGLNATSEAMFGIGQFSNPATGTLLTVSLAAGQSISLMFRSSEDAKKGFFEFMASGTSVTNIFTNIYEVDPTNGNKSLLWNSANIATLIPTTLGYVRSLIPSLNQPELLGGDNLMLEIVNGGANAMTVVAKTLGTPNHPTEFPKNFGGSRALASTGGNSPATLTDSQVTYSSVVPYINIGILEVPADYQPQVKASYINPNTYTFTTPTWMKAGDKLDLIGIGAGGGGGNSIGPLSGQGGGPGVWNGVTLTCGTDFPPGAQDFVFTVPAGGSRTNNGAPLTITYNNMAGTPVTITCPGGPYGGNGSSHNPANPNTHSDGVGAGDYIYNGVRYFGSADVSMGNTGNRPGGGGGGAISYSIGASGGAASGFAVARQP